MKTLVAELDAALLAAVNELQEKHVPVTVTKDGKAVAQLVALPAIATGRDSIFGFYKGKLKIVGDIMSPIYTDEENEAFLESSASQINDRS